MKREILFRGFHCGNGTQIAVVNGKEYRGEWVEGCYVYDNNLNHHIRAFDYCYYAVIPETVGQFTGLTDKNGKKIFEHDRIKYKCGDIAEVIFTEYGAFVGETESLSHENIGGVLTEVIGNKCGVKPVSEAIGVGKNGAVGVIELQDRHKVGNIYKNRRIEC